MVALRRAGALLLMIVLAVGSSGSVAGAKKKHKKGRSWGSSVTLTQAASTQFAGAVSSKLGACAQSRVVTLTYTDPNTNQTLPLSVQRTDAAGGYQVTLTKDAFPGTYRVSVEERRITARKAPQRCLGAESGALVVPSS
jgi:hypothetical protein